MIKYFSLTLEILNVIKINDYKAQIKVSTRVVSPMEQIVLDKRTF